MRGIFLVGAYPPAGRLLGLALSCCLILVLPGAAQARARVAHAALAGTASTDELNPNEHAIESVITEPQFSSVSAGEIAHPDGTISLYVTPDGMSSLGSALESAVGSPASGGYTLIPASHSYAALEATTMKLASDKTSLDAQGIHMVEWGPDIASNSVLVQVQGASPGATATSPAVLNSSTYGNSMVTTAPWVGPLPAPAKGRLYDSPPFVDGDQIALDNSFPAGCTDAFDYVAYGQVYNTTAGHCYGGSVWANPVAHNYIGNISTEYFNGSSGWDVESFHCGSCGTRTVYYYNGSTHLVHTSECYCGVGSLLTADGSFSQEVPDTTVQKYNFCGAFSDGITRCHLAQSFRPGYVACQPGDSGGPMYQRTDNNYVYPAGMIVGYTTPGNGQGCIYHEAFDLYSMLAGTVLGS